MKIAIDVSRAIIEKAGIGRYTREIIKNLINIDSKNEYILLFTYFRKDQSKEDAIKEFEKTNVKIKKIIIPGTFKERIWSWKIPWFDRFLEGADLFFAPSFMEMNLGLKIPQVVTIHDLTTFLFPEQRGKKVSKRLSKQTKKCSMKAKKIIAISENTRNDLISILKIPPLKVKVIYPGLTPFTKTSESLPFGLRKKRYLLTVGTVEPRKNLIGLFRAYADLPPKLKEEYPLVVVGAEGWEINPIYEVVQELNLRQRIKFLGFQKDENLAKLYQEAALFIFPSLYEGFGLPLLEAMSFGVPIISSKSGSLGEVGGKAVRYIDPRKPEEITLVIAELLKNKKEREKLAKLGLSQVKKFSWQKAAKDTLKVLREAARG